MNIREILLKLSGKEISIKELEKLVDQSKNDKPVNEKLTKVVQLARSKKINRFVFKIEGAFKTLLGKKAEGKTVKFNRKDLGAIEKNIFSLLVKNAEKFRHLKFSFNNFVHEFTNELISKTPIGEVNIDFNSFDKLKDKNRDVYFGLIKPTLEKPLVIIEHEDAVIFLKTFIDSKRMIYFVSIAKEKSGELTIVSNHEKSAKLIEKKIKDGKIRWINHTLGTVETEPPTPQSPNNFTKYISVYIGIPLLETAKIKNKKPICKKTSVKKPLVNPTKAKVSVNKRKSNVKKTPINAKKTVNNGKSAQMSLFGLDKEDPAWFPQYKQFKHKPKEAIKHLIKVKKGDCVAAMYRQDIGDIDIIWGENDSKTNVGFGLKHIIEKHGKEIESLGFKVEDFIPIVVQFGKFNQSKSDAKKKVFENEYFRFVVSNDRFGKKSNWLLTAFNIEKRLNKKALGTIKTIDPNSLTIESLLQKTSTFYSVTKIQKPFQKNNNSKKGLDGIMSIASASETQFDLLGLDGEYLNMIGEACRPTSFFMYGPGGSGKSTFTLKFAHYLAQKGNKVAYVAGEQYNTPVLKKMLERLKLTDIANFHIVKNLEVINPGNYDVIVIDSKDSLDITNEDFKKLQEKFPKQTWAILSQATKDGGFTGSEKWRNLVDTMIYCEDGVAATGIDKNRWGGKNEIKIY